MKQGIDCKDMGMTCGAQERLEQGMREPLSPPLACFYLCFYTRCPPAGLLCSSVDLMGWRWPPAAPRSKYSSTIWWHTHLHPQSQAPITEPQAWESHDANVVVKKQPHILKEMCWAGRATRLGTSREHCSRSPQQPLKWKYPLLYL